jgi:tetratricopeptide (TPR) repeat protein/TolB-like protein
MGARILLAILLGFSPEVTRIQGQLVSGQAQVATEKHGVRVGSTTTVTQHTDIFAQRRDYALLFATNEYDSWEPLINPVPDAEAIAAELKDSYAFSTEIIRNPTREQIVVKLREYSQKELDVNDQFFIFFAGHGIFDEVFRQGYIVAKDSRRDDETRGTYESYDDLRAIVNSMRAKHILLVMDACYSGAFDRRIQEGASRGSDSYANLTFPELFSKKTVLSTRKFLTSGGKDYVPDGLPGHHSPFAAHLLEELRTYGRNHGYLTFANLLTAVEGTNPQPFWGEWGENEPGSEFFFVSKQLLTKLTGNPATALSDITNELSRPARGDPTSRARYRPSIAVLGFRDLSAERDDSWLSTALAEWLTTELGTGEKLRVIAGENVARLKLDLALPDLSGYADDTLARINRSLGAGYVVSGSYSRLSRDSIRVDFRLQDVATGETIGQSAELGSKTDWTELVKRMGVWLRAKMAIELPTAEERRAVQTALPIRTEFSRPYAEGLAKLRAYDLLGARDDLQRAVDADPKSPLAHLALAKAWTELGYDSKARLEAATAANLSGNLPPASRSAIEGNSFRLDARWDRAIDIYRSLWTVYPDEADYGLELAAIQTEAGKGRDALVTLDTLRRQSPEAVDDPRVDYQEALAAGSLSDVKRKHTAAARSAEKASQQGARLLAAQAYWQDCSALFLLGDQKGAEAACGRANDSSIVGAGRKFQARSLTVLSNIRVSQGRSSEAMELRKTALGIAREIGSRKDMIGASMNLANLQRIQGQLDEAKANFDEAMRLAKETDDRQQLVILQLSIANLLYDKGDFSDARQWFERSMQDAEQLGDKASVATSSRNSAVLSLQLGEPSKAEHSARQAIAIADTAGLQAAYASSLGVLGSVSLTKGDLLGARRSYEEALQRFTKLNDQRGIAGSRLYLARLSLEEGYDPEAEELARQAAEAFRNQRARDEEASARETLARALLAQGKQAQALEEINAGQALSPRDFAVRALVTITAARIGSRSGSPSQGQQMLESCLRDADHLKLAGVQLELRLAQAEIETASDSSVARAHLQSLEQEARNMEYLLIATKARRLREQLR